MLALSMTVGGKTACGQNLKMVKSDLEIFRKNLIIRMFFSAL